ncbi:ORF6N domain-containing protein [Providencia hangzhouensis]|uniref:ORF6N domain-containing protein n=1 Tax=Providencia hangzhouensis TaxID=3031799 RepID=UPI0034DD36A7
MSTLTVQNLPPVQHNGLRVITTELLANVYETEINNIQQNFKRNKKRFIEGKHYFKIVGDALNNLRLTMSQLQISAKVRSLILWTERGAARHAKMLDTDNAWDVFEALEDFYFAKKEDSFHKTTTDDRAPLRNAVDCLMTKKRLSFPKAYGYVHAKYGVNSIDELPIELLPEAVDYIYKAALEGEYIPKQQLPQVGLESLAMPMSFFDDFDWLFEEENISKKEALSHADAYPRCMLKTAPEYPNPVGVLLNKLQSAGVDVSAAQIQLRALRNHLRATIMQLDIASRKDTKTLLSNTNVAFNHLKAIREEWRTTLAPAIEKLNPNLEYEVTRRLAEMNGAIYANLMSLQGTKSGKLLA